MEPRSLSALPAYDNDRNLHAVVEAPRGSGLKLEFDPDLSAFTVSRALPAGLVYPSDWGFIPGTQAEDGDPLDVMVMHEGATYPGVVLKCKPIGVIELSEKKKGGKKRVRNDRIIAVPVWNDLFKKIDDIPDSMRDELERFFVAVTARTGKKVKILRLNGSRAAEELIRDAMLKA